MSPSYSDGHTVLDYLNEDKYSKIRADRILLIEYIVTDLSARVCSRDPFECPGRTFCSMIK